MLGEVLVLKQMKKILQVSIFNIFCQNWNKHIQISAHTITGEQDSTDSENQSDDPQYDYYNEDNYYDEVNIGNELESSPSENNLDEPPDDYYLYDSEVKPLIGGDSSFPSIRNVSKI